MLVQGYISSAVPIFRVKLQLNMVAKVDRDFVELRTTDEYVPTVLNDMRTIHL